MRLIDRLFYLLCHKDEFVVLKAIEYILYLDGYNYFNNPIYMEKMMFLCQSPDKFYVNKKYMTVRKWLFFFLEKILCHKMHFKSFH